MPRDNLDYEALAARIGRRCNEEQSKDAENLSWVLVSLHDLICNAYPDEELGFVEIALDHMTQLRNRKLAEFYSREAAE